MSHKSISIAVLFVIVCLSGAIAQVPPTTVSPRVDTYTPIYLPVSDLLQYLGAISTSSPYSYTWHSPDGSGPVTIWSNPNTNALLLSGDPSGLDLLGKLMKETDVAPRQIEIKVQIIEISKNKSLDAGVDWDQVFSRLSVSGTALWQHDKQNIYESDRRTANFSANTGVTGAIHALYESGAGTVRTAPRILTLNNRPATILDGRHVTYVSRAVGYSNMYVTDTLDAGLKLSVLPSLAESGYITMHVSAELTDLESNTYSGSPIRNGQTIENTVVVRDGESVLLGGRSRTIQMKSAKRFPILGWVVPFLFSREVITNDEIESFVVLTPRAVPLDAGLDAQTKDVVENKTGSR